MNVTVPAEAESRTCPDCGGPTYLNPHFETKVREDNGHAAVSQHCQNGCGWLGALFSWEVAPAEYEGIYGHPLPRLAGNEPTPPEARVLPPGPWGVFGVEPSPIPDEAWLVTCDNKIGRWRRKTCGAYLEPRPTEIDGSGGVFYYDEFTSTATVGYGRCPRCQQLTLVRYDWPLTPEQHYAIFGRTPDEYAPLAPDPDDEDDYEIEFSMWRTADRGMLMGFPDVNALARSEDVDLRAVGPGEWTIKHWPTGAVWDAPEWVAQHEHVMADADTYFADDEDNSEYDEDYDEAE